MKIFKILIFSALFISFFVNHAFAQENNLTHIVKKGETVRTIALKYNITPYKLLKLNPDINDPLLAHSKIIVSSQKTKQNFKKSILVKEASKKEKVVYVDSSSMKMHLVKKKETIYALKKKYNITEKQLFDANPTLIDGLKSGMTLFIPNNSNEKEKKSSKNTQNKRSNYIMHIIQPKETKWGICHKYGMTEEQLILSNPIVAKGFNYNDTLWIPKKDLDKLKTKDDINYNYTYYEVKPKDTPYGLSKTFKTTIGKLKKENPMIKDGLKIGMVLKIPKSPREVYDTVKYEKKVFTSLPNDSKMSSDEKIEVLDKMKFSKVVDVVLMLPFYLNNNKALIEKLSNNTPVDKNDKIYSKSAIALEFYNGALLAINSLKESGLSVRLRVFDTQNNLDVVKSIMDKNDFSEVNVVIGPLYTKSVEYVADRLKYDNVMVVSPLSKKVNLDNRYNLIQAIPTSFSTKNSMLNEIVKNNNNSISNLMIFGGSEDDVEVDFVKSRLESRLDSNYAFTTYLAEENIVDREKIFEMLTPNVNNIVIIASKNNVLVNDIVTGLNQIMDSIPSKVYLLDKPKGLSQIESSYLNNVSLSYPENLFINKNNKKFVSFEKKFKQKNKYNPNMYSYRGFDVTRNILYMLAKGDDFEVEIMNNSEQGVQGKFDYMRKPFGGYFNTGVFIVRYNNWNLQVVNK